MGEPDEEQTIPVASYSGSPIIGGWGAALMTRRPALPEDEAFLERVYVRVRWPELDPVPWSDAQKTAFLHSQFLARQAYYRAQFPQAQWGVLLQEGEPVGALILDFQPDEIRLMDIALLPEHRGAGLGTGLLTEIQGEARALGRCVRLHVEAFNPAQRLYARLGFRPVLTDAPGDGLYVLMEWTPDDTAS